MSSTPLGQQQPSSCGFFFDIANLNLDFPETEEERDQIFDIVLKALQEVDPRVESLLDPRFIPEANSEQEIEPGFKILFDFQIEGLDAEQAMAILDPAVPAIAAAMRDAGYDIQEGWAILEMGGQNRMGNLPASPNNG